MIDWNGANVYFAAGQHPRAETWAKFTPEQQQAALVQARRDLSRLLGTTLDDDEDAYEEGDVYREEYAVYEQALHVLMTVTFPNGESTAAAFLAVDPQAQNSPLPSDRRQLAPAAMEWLTGWNGGQLTLARG